MPFDLQHELTTRLSNHDCVYLAPDIPQRKLTAAVSIHAHHRPAEESVLALYDDTLFGGGEDGFILTARRICWKNTLSAPQQIAFADLDPATLSAERSTLFLAGGKVNISKAGGLTEALRDLLGLLSRRAPSAVRGLPEQIRRLALKQLGKADPVFYAPGIPPKKMRNAREIHSDRVKDGEPIIVLYDDTVFGSADEGFILTPTRLCWKNIAMSPRGIRWVNLDLSWITTGKNEVFINGKPITFTGQAELVEPAALMLKEIASLIQQGGSMPEPKSAPSVAVERCQYCGLRLVTDAATCPGCGGPA